MKIKNSNILPHTVKTKKQTNLRLGTKFVILIVLYFYLAPIICGFLGADETNFRYLEAIGSYLLVVMSVIIFGSNQLETFRDHFSLWMIVFACLLAAIFPRENALIYKIIFITLSATLSIYILINRKEIKTPNLKLVFIGLLWSISAVVVLALIDVWLGLVEIKSFRTNILIIIASTFWFQFPFLVVVEEAIFRGLIFSLLTMIGWKENGALFTQAILFWGIHYLDLSNPKLFFVIIPLGTLFTTLIIKKYKMLYMSAMMHISINIFMTLLAILIRQYLF